MSTSEFHAACGRALEHLATGGSLTEVLGILVSAAEHAAGGARCAISMEEGPEERVVVASDSEVVEPLLSRLASIGPEERGFVEDLATEARWRDLGGSGAVWWEPVRATGGAVIGYFLTTRARTGRPADTELPLGATCAHIAGIAIERKRREDDLRDRESEIRAVLEGVIDGIITIDQRGIIETFNRAAEQMFGYSAAEAVGKNVSILMDTQDAKEHDDHIRRYLETGEKRIIGIGREVTARKKDGTLFPVDLGVSEFRVGDVRKFTGILRDVTERRRLEAQVRQSQKLEAVGTLAAGVAHDFNNLLMGIMGCTSIALKKLPESSEARAFLDEAKAAAERGTKLTRQLLAFSRRTPAEARPMLLNDVIRATDVMLRRLIGEDIDLVLELDPSGGPIEGDVGQLEQVLVNLVVNARDAIEAGGRIVIRTSIERLVRRDVSGRHVCLAVSDDGCGMEPAIQARIFEPFYTTKGPDEGTGLGLSTVYGIAEGHAGFVEVDSAVGKGTTMRVFFPLMETEALHAASTTAGVPAGRGMVLVVEDDRLVRLAVGHYLRGAGYEVREAASGTAALDAIDRHGAPTVMLIDLVMSDMSGLDLLSKVRVLHPQVPALLMSGYATPADDRIKSLEAERWTAFIAKPFSEEDLAEKLSKLL